MEENNEKEKIEKKERCDDDATITLLWKNTKTDRCDIQNDIHTKQGTFDVYRNNSLELGTSGISILNVWLVSGISTESIFFFCNVKGRHQCFFLDFLFICFSFLISRLCVALVQCMDIALGNWLYC